MVDSAGISAPKGVALNCRLLEEVKIWFRVWGEECFENSHHGWSLYHRIRVMSGYPVYV